MPEGKEIHEREKGFVAHMLTWVAWVFCILAIYVLSLGPVLKLTMGGMHSPRPIVAAFYHPITWLCQKSTCAEQFMGWYLTNVWHVWCCRLSSGTCAATSRFVGPDGAI